MCEAGPVAPRTSSVFAACLTLILTFGGGCRGGAERQPPGAGDANPATKGKSDPESASGGPAEGVPPAVEPVPNPSRGVAFTEVHVDVGTGKTRAVVTLEPGTEGATLEIGDLKLQTVSLPDGADQAVATRVDGALLHLGVAADDSPLRVAFEYALGDREGKEGWLAAGSTLVWPYHCGKLFPCHPEPADGLRFALELTGVPEDQVAVYPRTIDAESPSYMLAWAVGPYTEIDLGRTSAGTRLSAWYRPGEEEAMRRGTTTLRDAFDFLARKLGRADVVDDHAHHRLVGIIE